MQSIESQSMTAVKVMALVATASVTIGVTAGLVLSAPKQTELHMPVSTATRPAVSAVYANTPRAPTRYASPSFATGAHAAYDDVQAFDTVQPRLMANKSAPKGFWVGLAGMFAIPVAMVAVLTKRNVASEPLLPLNSRWAMAATEAAGPQVRATTMQFIRGIDELIVPDVKLSRARDGSSGSAKFKFKNPTVFDSMTGEITGLYMSDEEGTFSTTNVNASFVNGNPDSIEAVYIMRSPEEWDRFMRFMERYAEENGLGFSKA